MLDLLVIGCGLSGAVVARYFAEQGKRVTIWERRDHIGGNMYDFVDKHGILVHQYGPHAFHTNNKTLIDYISRFGEWEEYKLTCMAEIDKKTTPTPFNFQTIDDFYPIIEAKELKRRIKQKFKNRETATVVELLEHSDDMIRGFAQFLFEKDYSLYTAKQWGVPASEIDPSVLKRVPVRFSYETGYFDDKYQVMPSTSYTDFFENLIDHPNISVVLNCEALEKLSVSADGRNLMVDAKIVDYPIIYTGALDELYGGVEGYLPYRSLHFEWVHEMIDSFQDAPVIAYPQEEEFTRITEYKKLPLQQVSGTSYAVEYPRIYKFEQKLEPYYPVLTEESQLQYEKYLHRAEMISNLYCCGRLADFKYYNMDQALERALAICIDIERSEYL